MKVSQIFKFAYITTILCFMTHGISPSIALSDGDLMQRTETSDQNGIDATGLPKTNRAGKKTEGSCYASYHIQKFGSDHSWEGGDVRYRIAVTNLGDCILTNVIVSDFFPKKVVFKNAYPKPEFVGHTYSTWTIAYLYPGETRYLDTEFQVKGCEWDQIIKNTGCAWNAMIGQQICAWVNTQIYARPYPSL